MSTLTSAPVIVEPEAAEYVAQIGLRKELDQMLDHARQTIPGLVRLRVEYREPYDMGPGLSVAIEALRQPGTMPSNMEVDLSVTKWLLNAFPMSVLENFYFYVTDGTDDAG